MNSPEMESIVKKDHSAIDENSLKKLKNKFGSFPTGRMLAALMKASELQITKNYSIEVVALFTCRIYKINKDKLIQWLYNWEDIINGI